MPPCPDEIAHTLDQNKPAHNHQPISQPITPRNARARTRALGSIGALRDLIRIKGMAIRIVGHAAVEVLARVAASTAGVQGSRAEAEAELHEGYAETGARAVFGGVRCVQEVGEQEADELKRHAYHGVPDEAEKRADGEAFHEDFVAEGAGGEDGGFPVWRGGVCGGLFVCL
jgi:hypothetical protein